MVESKVEVTQADRGCRCQSCEETYRVDLLVPDETWRAIRPTGSAPGGGLLCGRCIMAEIEALGEFGCLDARHRIDATRPQAVPTLREISRATVDGDVDRMRAALRPQAEGWQGVSPVLERLKNFVTCGCDDGEWSALRTDLEALIERLTAEREEMRQLLERVDTHSHDWVLIPASGVGKLLMKLRATLHEDAALQLPAEGENEIIERCARVLPSELVVAFNMLDEIEQVMKALGKRATAGRIRDANNTFRRALKTESDNAK